MFGVLLAGGALWLLLSWIPAHRPWTDAESMRVATDVIFRAEVERLGEWRLKSGPYLAANALAVLFGLWGVSCIVRGASHRPRLR